MIIVDIEMSGTNPQKNSVLSIGAVDFLHSEVRFYEECRVWDGAHIEQEALAVNGFIEAEARDIKKQSEAEIIKNFLAWLAGREEKTLAGQNPQFDLGFIIAAAYRAHANISVAHRLLDLHSMTYMHMVRQGITPPVEHDHSGLNSDAIMKYVGIPSEPRPHKALNGALWEAEAFHRIMFNTPLLDEFAEFPVPWMTSGK